MLSGRADTAEPRARQGEEGPGGTGGTEKGNGAKLDVFGICPLKSGRVQGRQCLNLQRASSDHGKDAQWQKELAPIFVLKIRGEDWKILKCAEILCPERSLFITT